jgi:IS30 family transposase
MELMLTMTKRNMVPDAEWERQGRLLELGVKHASVIAMELGLSAQTVSRELKRRGFRKNALLHLSMAKIERSLAQKARSRAIMDLPEALRRQHIAQANMGAAAVVIQALIKADLDGDITKANAVIEPLADAVGAKVYGRRRKA